MLNIAVVISFTNIKALANHPRVLRQTTLPTNEKYLLENDRLAQGIEESRA